MSPILKNILAVIAGLVIGSLVNGGLISVSSFIIPPPKGVDLHTTEGLKEGMHLFKPVNFVMPFIAHALGTFTGAFVAAWVAASNKLAFALVIGILFLIGGSAMVFMLPSPAWFSIVDLLFAYIPMAWLGYKFAPKGGKMVGIRK